MNQAGPPSIAAGAAHHPPHRLLDWGAEHTRRLHVRFAVLEAAALGILANAPVVALRSLGSPPWQLALALAPSSLGIFLDLYLGAHMAPRAKVPYVRYAALAFAAAVGGMIAVEDSLAFNLLLGFAMLGQVVSQMAFASIVRGAYPAAIRGAIAGGVRSQSALTFFAAALSTALLLDWCSGGADELVAARVLLGVAAVAACGAAFVVSGIRSGDAVTEASPPRAGPLEAVRSVWGILSRDARFRLYLGAALVAGLGSLMTAPYVNAFLVGGLGLGYLPTLTIAQLVPQMCAAATTRSWGRRIDRHNVWQLWTTIRTVWGLSFVGLGVAAAIAPHAATAALVIAVTSTVAYGCVMGGSWLLWWQLGVGYFAKPGADTSRYISMVAMVSGVGRLIGPGAGALVLVFAGSLPLVFVAGGLLTIVGGLACRTGHRAERGDPRFATVAAFEASVAAVDPEGDGT